MRLDLFRDSNLFIDAVVESHPSGGLILITLVSRIFRKTLNLIKLEWKKRSLQRFAFWKCFSANKARDKSFAITGTDRAGGVRRKSLLKMEFVLRDLKHHISLSLIFFLIFNSTSCIINVPWIFLLSSARQRAFRFDFLRHAFSDIFSLGAIDYSFLESA